MDPKDLEKEEVTDHLDVLQYSGGEITELDGTKVPLFLKYTYAILPIWGIFWGVMYWNGSKGWLDRGYWSQLQQAANTRLESPKDLIPIKKKNLSEKSGKTR